MRRLRVGTSRRRTPRGVRPPLVALLVTTERCSRPHSTHRLVSTGRDGWMAGGLGRVYSTGRPALARQRDCFELRAGTRGGAPSRRSSRKSGLSSMSDWVPVGSVPESHGGAESTDGAPAMLARAGEERDLPNIAAIHDACRRRRFTLAAIQRSSPMRWPALPPVWVRRLRQVEFFVAEEGASAAACALSENAHG